MVLPMDRGEEMVIGDRRFIGVLTQQILKLMAGSSPMENLPLLPEALQTTVIVVVLVKTTTGGGHGPVVALFKQHINS